MKFYVGGQWQDNALQPIGSFNPAVVSNGQYCTVSANNTPIVFGVTTQPYTLQSLLISVTFYIYANTGVTGGNIQPQIQLASGVYLDYGPLVTPTAAGFVIAVNIPTPVAGAQFNVTSPIVGGSCFLEIDALLI